MQRWWNNISLLTIFREFIFWLFGWAKNYCDETDETGMFVRFTNKCRNHCHFCIEKTCDRSWKNVSGKTMAEKTNESGRRFVNVGGGEPCLDMDRLLEYVENLDSNITLTYLVTSLPKECKERQADFEKILSRFQLVDISSHGTTDEDDEKTYRTQLEYGKQAFIAELAAKFPDKVYVSCVLSKSGVDDYNKLIARIAHYYGMGIKHLYLNEMCLTGLFAKDEQFVSIDDIFADRKIRFGSAFTHTCKLDISKYFQDMFPGIDIRVRRRCFRCGSGGDRLTWGDVLKTAFNKMTLRKQATPVLNNNGLITDWYPEKSA